MSEYVLSERMNALILFVIGHTSDEGFVGSMKYLLSVNHSDFVVEIASDLGDGGHK